jgi:formylglycine-generating enzyme required for sulfatase activity
MGKIEKVCPVLRAERGLEEEGMGEQMGRERQNRSTALAAVALLVLPLVTFTSCSLTRQEDMVRKATGGAEHSALWEELGIEFAYLAGGTFMMGMEIGTASERPVHEVTIGSFLLAKAETTLGQFARFVEAAGYVTDAEKNGYCRFWTGTKWAKTPDVSWRTLFAFQGPDHPAGCVSWNDAEAFSRWAGLRLPTEAEWEYAARAGSAHGIWAGTDSDSDLADYAWFRANSGLRSRSIATRKPNAFGLFDMSGNVWEWCSDWYDEAYYGDSPSLDPAGPERGRVKVARGGSAYFDVTRLRVSHRGRYLPDYAHGSIGFRTALDAPR